MLGIEPAANAGLVQHGHARNPTLVDWWGGVTRRVVAEGRQAD